ncbi:hypothetical protein Esti_000491 [Eimeria stiedai]
MSRTSPTHRGAPDGGSSGVYRGSSRPTGATPSEVESENRLRATPHVSPELIGKMAADVRKVPADERHPLVNHDPEDVEQALEVALPGPHTHGKPAGRRWHGWRRGGGARRQSHLQRSLSCPNECVQQATGLPPSESQRSSDDGLYRWWRLCGLEPKTDSRHPREDVRFTTIILVTFFGLEIFVNFDCGAIPCTLSKMADEFRLSPTWQGMLGALPYVGLTLASPFAGRVFAQWRAKRVILYSMVLNAAATLLMVLTVFLPTKNVTGGMDENAADTPADALATNSTPTLSSGGVSGLFKEGEGAVDGGLKPFFHLPDFSFVDLTPSAILLLCSRLLVGFTQAPFVIYAPVWVDEFAPPKKAALWMGIMQGAAVVGVTVGYLCAGVLAVYLGLNWRSAIGIQVVFLCLLTAITASFPRQFVETPGSPESSERREACAGFPGEATIEANVERERMQQRRESASGLREAFSSSSVVVELPKNDTERSPYSGTSSTQQVHATGDVEVCPPSPASETHKIRPENTHRSTPDAEGGEDSGANVLPVSRGHRRAALALMTTPMYVSPMLTLCALLFVVTGVQFWGTVFFASSLGLTPTVAMLAFAAVAATSPIAGVVMGGVTVDAVGGYKTLSGRKRTLYACTAYAAGAVAFAVIGSFSTNPYLCIASLWFLLCFGAAMLPPLTGVQIDAVAPPLRTLASGMSMFFYNILGYALGNSDNIWEELSDLFAGAFLPGVVMDLFRGGDVLGLRLVLLWSFFGLIFVSLTAMYARRLERRGISRVDLCSARQLSVLPTPVAIPSHSPKSSDISRRISGSQGFLPVPGEAAWRQQEHAD